MIEAWRTAIGRLLPSAPARAAVGAGLVRGKVLDYGCGRGTDVEYFRKHSTIAVGYDPGQAAWAWPPQGKYDFVQCAFVLNVIEDPAERVDVLKRIKGHLKAKGRALIAVRGAGDLKVKKTWEPRGDGWRTPANTFQRAFTRDELERICRKAGLTVINEPGVRLPGRITWVVVGR
jgi:DNA phosphorothioation-associated putative methyltransferase